LPYLVQLFQTLSAFLVLFYLYCESPAFQPLKADRERPLGKLRLFLFFTGITILGNYLGTPVMRGGALINSRAVGSVLAGLLGGPLLGGMVGVAAGLHRLTLGGASALAGAVATTTEGVLAGLVHIRMKDRPQDLLTLRVAFLTTLVGEFIHMGIVLLLSKPYPEAKAIVRLIGPPMICMNPVGAALLMAILLHRHRDLDRVAAASSAAALRVAERALGLLAQGFTPATGDALSGIVLEETGVGAVAVTDRERVLGFRGLGSDHHRGGLPISSPDTRRAIELGEVVFADEANGGYHCGLREECPLHTALIVPLQVDGAVLGTVQLFEPRRKAFLDTTRRLGEGIGTLLSSQLLIARYQEQKSLLLQGELRLLRAQVSPHFLFNALNTIRAVIRKDPDRGRDLLGHLSAYFRQNLKRSSEFSTLQEELEHLGAYVEIERARFVDLRVDLEVDPAFFPVRIPTFTLQPLLENAIKHGISRMADPGRVRVGARRDEGVLRIDVEDDAGAYQGPKDDEGLGLQIVRKRIASLLGPEAGLETFCVPGELTRMTIRVPLGGPGA
jgi:two-component system LytT family sensor kinase